MFGLGQVVATPGALDLLANSGESGITYLKRHQSGDWGDLSNEDKAENEYSLKHGLRLLSAYSLPNSKKLWIITEADRSATTLLLPDEY